MWHPLKIGINSNKYGTYRNKYGKYNAILLYSYVAGIRLAQSFIGTRAMKVVGAKIKKFVHPKCKDYKYDSDYYWQCYIRENTLSMAHPVGTCKMGAPDDPTAVVDPQLRYVYFK